ncbi:MAG: hypothetical protein GC171_07920 [Terrimonas sp.]|nr:hypothetical protein [Terrimonas sp.]
MPFLKNSFLIVCLLLIAVSSKAQTTFLPQDAKENIVLERLEIKAQRDSVLNFSKTKPFNRKYAVAAPDRFELSGGMQAVSKVDAYNIRSLYLNNVELLPDSVRARLGSKKPIGRFYQTPANLYEVHIKDFDLIINPVIQFKVAREKGNSESIFQNTRGLTLRGRISNKIGFAAYLTDNQERDPVYVQNWENKFKSVPGAGFYKNFKGTGFDYFDARGYITFNAAKYIDITFGYDRNFIGNGYRSLFLSDFSNNTLFLKLNTRIWKFNYQNLFMELNQTEPRGPDRLLRKKYAAFHHLDVDLTKSVNVGLFEGVVFGRSNHFEFGYLVPVIFYRSIEQQNGSADNSVAGIDVKANILKRFQVYGQFLLDEFNLKQIKANTGWWANKWGLQMGARYIDAFNIRNLDLQVEMNAVRPFTYSHRDSVANYTHYNQPLAHPLGANFRELIGIARYQPAPRWLLIGKLMAWKQGLDIGAQSYGSNIFLPNVPPFRMGDYGYKIGSGMEAKTVYASFLLSYELRENLFIEASGAYRKTDVPASPALSSNTSIVSFGIRWNAFRREFEF